MKHWQFYIAVILLIILIFAIKMRESMELRPDLNAVMQTFTPEQNKLKDHLMEANDRIFKKMDENNDPTYRKALQKELISETSQPTQDLVFSLTPQQMDLLPSDTKQMVEKGKKIMTMTIEQIGNMTSEELNLDGPFFVVLIERLKQLGITLSSQQMIGMHAAQLNMLSELTQSSTTDPMSSPMSSPPMSSPPMSSPPMLSPMSSPPMLSPMSSPMSSPPMSSSTISTPTSPSMYKEYIDLQEKIINIQGNYSTIQEKVYGLESKFTNLQGQLNGQL